MPISKNNGSWNLAKHVWVNVSGTWKECLKVYINQGGTWKLAHAKPMTVGLSTSNVSGNGDASSCITASSTVTVTDGYAPFTYSWAMTSYSGPAIPFANSPTSATSTFEMNTGGPTGGFTGTFACTVTDAFGNTATTGNVTADFNVS